MTEKPRCRTCPHAYVLNETASSYVCELNPPDAVPTGTIGRTWDQPRVLGSEGCSHHPDFTAWLSGRAKSCS
jgi:hypothetical protein